VCVYIYMQEVVCASIFSLLLHLWLQLKFVGEMNSTRIIEGTSR